MINIIVTGKPSDGLFFYSCEHYWRLKELNIPVQLIVFTHRHFDKIDYLNSVKEKYTKTIPIEFNDYDPNDRDINLIMGRSMLTLAYKTWKDYSDDQQLALKLIFLNPLISVYSENHPIEYYEALKFFNVNNIYNLCDHDVYVNGYGEHFEKYIHFDYYKPPINNIQFEHIFIGTTPEYYQWANEVIDKYNNSGIIVYKATKPYHLEAPVNNLLGIFNRYVYVKKTFDPAPRILQECLYYNKEVIFDRPNLNDGGSVYWNRGLKKPNIEPILKVYNEYKRTIKI